MLDVVSDLWCSSKQVAGIRSRGRCRVFVPGSDEVRGAFFHVAKLVETQPEEEPALPRARQAAGPLAMNSLWGMARMRAS
jgi:hypothetical protein